MSATMSSVSVAVRITALASLLAAGGCTPKEIPTTPHPQQLEVARTLAKALGAGQYQRATLAFSKDLKRRLSPKELQRRWESINEEFGPITEINGVRSTAAGGYQILYLRGEVINKPAIDMRVVFKGSETVVGLWFRPSSTTASYEPLAVDVRQGKEEPFSAVAMQEAVQRLVQQLQSGKFAEASQIFDDGLRKQYPPPRLADTWRGLQAGQGELLSTRVLSSSDTGLVVVSSALEFQNGAVAATFTFTRAGRLLGLTFAPLAPKVRWRPPQVDSTRFREEAVVLGEGEATLPGTLTLPSSYEEPVPAVVLVAGLGAWDRDLTVGGTKLFKDLAWELGTRGVATLRWDTRAQADPASLGEEPTWQDHLGKDALAALELLRRRQEIDPERLFLLGHGWGGALVPQLASTDGRAAGVISLSAQPEGVSAAVLEESADGHSATHAIPASVWRSLEGYQPAEAAAALNVPVAVLLGDRDPQLSPADFARWHERLGEGGRVWRMEQLNHYLMQPPGAELQQPETPREHELVTNVPAQVVHIIGQMILTPHGASARRQ